MKNFLCKVALQTAIPVLCALVLLNAYLVSKNLKLVQTSTGLRVGASEIQAHISNAALDLQGMETSQRGYLLTGDPAYLKPFNAANERLTTDLGHLRSRLTGKDLSLESQLESVAGAKITEMKETVRLRQLGYRHRAFVIVDSNRGRDLMDQARASLDGLSAAQSSNVATFDKQLKESVSRAFKESAYANSIFLAVALVTLFIFHWYRTRLELGYARHDEKLRATTLQLETLSSTVFRDCRAVLGEIRSDAEVLLDRFGSFLPRQGCEKIERIQEGAGQMIASMEAVSTTLPAGSEQDVPAPRLESLSA